MGITPITNIKGIIMKIKIEFSKKEVKELQNAGSAFFAREDEFNDMIGVSGSTPAKINKDVLYWEKSQNEEGGVDVEIKINKDWACKAIRIWTESFNAVMNFVLAVAPATRLLALRMKKSNAELNELTKDLIE